MYVHIRVKNVVDLVSAGGGGFHHQWFHNHSLINLDKGSSDYLPDLTQAAFQKRCEGRFQWNHPLLYSWTRKLYIHKTPCITCSWPMHIPENCGPMWYHQLPFASLLDTQIGLSGVNLNNIQSVHNKLFKTLSHIYLCEIYVITQLSLDDWWFARGQD